MTPSVELSAHHHDGNENDNKGRYEAAGIEPLDDRVPLSALRTPFCIPSDVTLTRWAGLHGSLTIARCVGVDWRARRLRQFRSAEYSVRGVATSTTVRTAAVLRASGRKPYLQLTPRRRPGFGQQFRTTGPTAKAQAHRASPPAHKESVLQTSINGLPVFTFELKNSLTKQTADDAVLQYQQDRNPREKLFEFGRCIAHFAVDEREVQFCTRLAGKASWFLPFNRGWYDGAGNPPNPDGLAIDYLWREVLTRRGLTDILENYAQVVEAKDEQSGRKRRTQIWPRYYPARRGAPPAGRRRRPRCGQALPDPALGGQRQEQLDRLAGPLTDRADQGRRAGLRLDHRRDRPGHPRPSDSGHDQAVRAGGGDGRSRRALGRPAPVH